MTEHLLQLDRQLFHFVNYTLSNPVFDAVMPWLRNPKFWIPLYVFIVVFSIARFKKAGTILIVLLLITVGIADYGSASILKAVVKRTRPCREASLKPEEISRVPCGTGYSFPSTHASDHFAMALFLSLVYGKRWRWVWFGAILWAGLICFAQVYVGVHYPVDVTAGALFGSIIGIGMAYLFKRIQPQFA
ncbi:phosphatase PAP2 family protein [Mucilaginibacter koreensis]